MALVFGELYNALRSANVPHELAQEAARVDNISPKQGVSAHVAYRELKTDIQVLQLLLAVNFAFVVIALFA